MILIRDNTAKVDGLENYYEFDTKALRLVARSEGKFVYRQLVPAE
jgi:hypothetical protein